jgi:Omp85 superfamily domain
MERRYLLVLPVALLITVIGCRSLLAQEEDGEDSPTPGWRYEFQRKYELPRDYGHDWRLSGLFGLNPEEGLVIGGGPILYEFGFRSFPFVYRMQLTGEIAVPQRRYRFVYSLLMPKLTDGLSLELQAHASELEVTNFYGFGNNSPRDEAKEGEDFYRVASREFLIHPMIYRELSQQSFLGFGLSYKHFRVRHKENRFYDQFALDSLGDNRSQLGVGATLHIDTRDYGNASHNGVFLDIDGWTYVDPAGTERPFRRIAGEGRWYFGDTLFTDIMLAMRAGGEKIFGTYPFYESAFLGGDRSLRGFQAQRFAGDASVFGNVELRVALIRARLIVPTELGVFVLGDAGRVWLDGTSEGRWHSDAGGGVWLAPLNRDFLLSLLVAASVDGLFFRAATGFAF